MQNDPSARRKQHPDTSHLAVRLLFIGIPMIFALSEAMYSSSILSAVVEAHASDPAGTLGWKEWIPLASSIAAALVL